MKNLFDKFGKKEAGLRFAQADLSETVEEFRNPARGWYQIYTFMAEQEPDFEERKWCLDAKDALVLVLIDIGSFRKKELDDGTLNRICRILRFFEENRYDCIVRVVYDHEGKAFMREPADFAQVQAHMRQIADVIKQCAASVFVYQGMLLGNWGEMHGSRFLDDEKMRRLADILRREKAPGTFLAVRRPVYWRKLHAGQRKNVIESPDNMGLFDDGIFGSESHLGTFDEAEREHMAWGEPWRRREELEFETELSHKAPNGGEAVYESGYSKTLTPERVIEDLRKMQITYLNKVHDERVLKLWKEWNYPGKGVWAGKSVYDYVGAHLGYRFLIRRVKVVRARDKRGWYRIEAEIENTGFGGFYQEAEICLEYTDCSGRRTAAVLENQMKGWKCGEIRKVSCMAEAGEGEIFLTARRKQDEAVIRFANRTEEEGSAVLGYLHIKY